MRSLRKLWIQTRSFLLSLLRRSFRTHASVWVSDLTQSLSFYRELGFRQVTSTRGDEVILLRNHRGDEINLVRSTPDEEGRRSVSHAVFQIEDLDKELPNLRSLHPELEIIDDAMTRRVQLNDPRGNVIEFYEQRHRNARPGTRIYHIATQPEINAGLTEHYYLPPDEENRFVRARARSAFVSLVCQRVAEEANAVPLVVEMDESQLSIEAQLVDDAGFDPVDARTQDTYPRVNSPIPRPALTAVGACEEQDGDCLWPTRFTTLTEYLG